MEPFCALKKIVKKNGKETVVCDDTRSYLLQELQKIQDRDGFISDGEMQDLADRLNIHPVEVYSVVTFYSFFSTQKSGRHVIRVSQCMPCVMKGSAELVAAFEKKLGIRCGETTQDGKFTLEKTSCIGMCDQAPAILVDGQLLGPVRPEDVGTIIENIATLKSSFSNLPKLSRKGPVLFGEMEPWDGLKKALTRSRSDVIEEVRASAIKGRGGAGFPTGVKWNLAAAAKADKKFVVCNADEGEPGTFKDRILLTEYPALVLEGMVIAAYAIGASQGYIYLRGEYKSLGPILEQTMAVMREKGVLGCNILGKEKFDFDIEIRLGVGAYVCGEETALIESLEGQRGEPRNRPPFPVNTGFLGYPTIVNNVETMAAIPSILSKGASWFRKIGTEKSSGSKIISVSGDCNRPGVYEVPFGTTIDEVLKLVDAQETQAVQVGGASGICIGPAEFSRKLAFEDLATGGSIIIFNKTRRMLDTVANFLEFFKEESCGQCTPCREGIPVLIEGLEKIKQGTCSRESWENLLSLSETMQCASKCGLGQSAPNALLAVMKNFTKEYKIQEN